MGVPTITGLVDLCTSLYKLVMMFNNLTCVSVDTWMIQYSLPYLISDTELKISCITHMKTSFIQEIITSKQTISHINVSSKKVMHKRTKIRNNLTSSTHILLISQKRYILRVLFHLNISPLQWCHHWPVSSKQSKTSRSSSNTETRAIYTRVLYQNWIKNFYRSIGFPIGPPSKLYKDNQATIKRVLEEIITTQAIHLNVLISALHELHTSKKF